MLEAAIVAAIAAVAVALIVYGIAPRGERVDLLEARLAQFGETGRPISLAEVEMSLPFAERVFRPFFEMVNSALSNRIKATQRQAIQEKLNLAGHPYGLTVGSFLLMRLLCPFLGAALFWELANAIALQQPLYLVAVVAGGVIGFLLPDSLVSRRIRARQKEILLALPSALDLLTISVEAGLGFDAAMGRVCDKYHNALTNEFNQALNEIRLGRPRFEALDEMGKRTKVEELNNFCQAVIQSEQLGVGIANVLRIQSEEIRRRRRQRAEEAGQKAPLKMLFPMVGCIFPTLFLVLLGPAAVQLFGGSS